MNEEFKIESGIPYPEKIRVQHIKGKYANLPLKDLQKMESILLEEVATDENKVRRRVATNYSTIKRILKSNRIKGAFRVKGILKKDNPEITEIRVWRV